MTQLLPLGEVAQINPATPVAAAPDDFCSFVPMDAVDETSASISKLYARPYRDVAKGYTTFSENDVLLAKITPCMENGKCAIARGLRGGIGFGTTEFHVVRASPKVLPEWIYFFWRLPQTRLHAERNMTGSAGQKRVPVGFLEELSIPVPSLDEQERYIKLLTNADRLTRTRRYALQLCDEFRATSFHDRLAAVVTMPTLLIDLCTKITDGVHITPTYVRDGVPFLRVTDVQDDRIDWDNVKRIPQEEYDLITRRTKPARGDILYSKNGTIGVAKEITWDVPFAHFVSLALLKPRRELIHSTFLTEWLNTPEALKQATRHSKTGTVTNLHLNEIEQILVPLPTGPDQERLVTLIKQSWGLRSTHVEALRQADHLFQTLLHDAFAR